MTVRFDAQAVARLERAYAAPEIAEQRARTRALLGARRGERGLDIGCGPGFLACELVGDVGAEGGVVALDSSPEMLQAARARLGSEGLGERVSLVDADATRLPFRGQAFDFIVAVQVYLYVHEVERALADAGRVLRPGGRLVVVDTDWDSCICLTEDRARHRRIMDARAGEFAQPHLPPRLPALLREAGLRLIGAEAIPLLDVRGAPGSFGRHMIGLSRAAAIRHGVPREQAEAWEADLQARTGDGDWFFGLNRYAFLAVKP